ncbi:MAG: LapA family protein [Calditrichaeota bacterium]|nr:MAG: LapA family protein [Calditrichota bacterium]MBL1204260.1 LapA family protein [Calditrichota bacterium]NOG44090.1 LapA family protein [Calditrichota bacterium]
MRLVLTIFWIILAFFILWIFTLNINQTVDINLLFAEFEKVNLVTVIFSSIFLGFVFGIIFFLIQFAKSKKENFQMKRQINALQTELGNLQNSEKESLEAINPPIEEEGGDELNKDKNEL